MLVYDKEAAESKCFAGICAFRQENKNRDLQCHAALMKLKTSVSLGFPFLEVGSLGNASKHFALAIVQEVLELKLTECGLSTIDLIVQLFLLAGLGLLEYFLKFL